LCHGFLLSEKDSEWFAGEAAFAFKRRDLRLGGANPGPSLLAQDELSWETFSI